jgi:hypothetical protein
MSVGEDSVAPGVNPTVFWSQTETPAQVASVNPKLKPDP